MTMFIILVATIWVLTLAGSIVAIVFALLDESRQRKWSALLAVASVLISTMALAGRTPFGSFPEFGYSWTNGALTISVKSGWLFVLPLICGVVALVISAWKQRTRRTGWVVLALVGLVAVLLMPRARTTSSVAVRPVKLVISGPEGQSFTGNYVADGVTNCLSAVAPATIRLEAKEVAYEFKREGGAGEFRVELFVGELRRTSTTSGRQTGVRGSLRFTERGESCWAAGF